MTRLAIALLFILGLALPASAQNVQCPDRPEGDSTNACANTRFVTTAINNTPTNDPTQSWTNDFTLVMDPNFNFTRSGTGWDYNVSHALTAFSTNVAMRPVYQNAGATNSGIGIWGLRTNYFHNSTAPATQAVSFPSGTSVCYVLGSGSLHLVATGIDATATVGTPALFSTASLVAGTGTISGSPTFAQCERVGAAGLSLGAPSAPIITAGADVTRNADSLTIPTAVLGVGTNSGTIVWNGTIPVQSANNSVLFQLTTANGNYYECHISNSLLHPTCIEVVNGVTAATVSVLFTYPNNVIHRYAFSYSPTSICISVDGSSTRCTASYELGDTVSIMQVGNSPSLVQPLYGYIHDMAAWNGQVSSGLLQAISLGPIPWPVAIHGLGGMGQSDMWGNYASPAITTTPPYPNQVYMPNDYWQIKGCASIKCRLELPGIQGPTAAFEFDGPVPPCNGIPAPDGNCGESPFTSFGAEAVFAGYPNSLILRDFAAPGHTIAEILPGTQAYINYTDYLTIIKSQTQLASSTFTFDAMAFNHAQTDAIAGTDPTSYCNSVLSLQGSTQTDGQAITGQVGNIPFLIAQYASEADATATYTAQCMITLITTFPTKFYAALPTYFLRHTPTHGPHYINTAQRLQGEYLGKCFKDVPSCGSLYPTSAVRVGAVITLTMNDPVSPMVQDIANMPQGAAWQDGLYYMDDTMSAHIISHAIVDATHISVTLNTTPTGTNGYIFGAMNGEPGVNPQQETQTINNRTPLAISNPGTGGIPGPCTVTLNLDPTHARAQAQYAMIVDSTGALSSFADDTPVAVTGRYSAAMLSLNQNNVPVTGCNLTGATLSGINIVMNPDGMVSDGNLPTITGWDGIASGTCIVTGNPAGANFKPAWNVSVTASVPTITSVSIYGNYPNSLLTPPSYNATLNNVPVVAAGTCGVTTALLQNVNFIQGFASNLAGGTWTNIRDSDPRVGWAGDALPNWLWAFALGPL